MCNRCVDRQISRRSMMAWTGLGLAALAGATAGVAPTAALAAGGPKTSLSPDQALAALKQGNARYAADPQLCVADLAKRRASLTDHQSPWAIIIGCADSRVPPELLFGGLGVGELFVARNAGNLVDTATLGTAEYGAEVLGAPLIVVLGHEHCGAVAAACDAVTKNATFPGSIGPMIAPIMPAVVAVRGQPGDLVHNAVRESARQTAAKLPKASNILASLAGSGKLKIAAACYDLGTGKVEFLG